MRLISKAASILILLCGAVSSPARADGEMTAGDLASLCSATDQVASTACRFYILGIVQGVGLSDGAYLDATTRHLQERKRTIFCPPENTPQTQMVAVVKDTIKLDLGAYPDDRKLPAASTIVGVMVHKFPCPK
jgi:hypothetical protein